MKSTDNDENDVELDPAEFIFLIDMSGSMYWSEVQKPINLAQGALRLFLHSLPDGSKFNIVQYGSRFTSTFPKSVVYDETNFKQALKDVDTYHERSMGGTNIFEPLEHIFSQERDKKLDRQVFLLTDGAVGNTA